MPATYGYKSNITLLTVLAAVFAAACYTLSFFPEVRPETLTFSKDLVLNILFRTPEFTHPGWISAVTAGAFTAVTCISLYIVAGKMIPDKNDIAFIPLCYLMLTTSVPEAVFFTQYHIASLLLVWSFHFLLQFRMSERHIGFLFLAVFFTSFASLFYFPLIWFCLPLTLLNINSDMSKLKYLLVILGAVLTPFIIYFSTIYLFWDFGEVVAKNTACIGYLTEAAIPHFSFTIPTAIFTGVLTLASLIASLFTANMESSKVITVRGYIRVTFTLLSLLAIILVYCGVFPDTSCLLLFMPVSMLLFLLFSERLRKGAATVIFLTIAGILLYIRISALF